MREEGVNAYAAGAHGDHLVHGLSTGTGYAGATAARGDTTAPTGSLPAGDEKYYWQKHHEQQMHRRPSPRHALGLSCPEDHLSARKTS